MKKVSLIFAMFFAAGMAFAQTEETNEVKTTEPVKEHPVEAAKGVEISDMATTIEGGKEKGVSISSAARRSGIMNARAAKAAENAEKGAEASEAGRAMRPAGAGRPDQIGRPDQPNRPATVTVPAARPTPPVVRPTAPGAPTTTPPTPPVRPVTPPAGNPGGGL